MSGNSIIFKDNWTSSIDQHHLLLRSITCTYDIWIRSSVGVTGFASAYRHIGCRIMGANCIWITSTIIYCADIYTSLRGKIEWLMWSCLFQLKALTSTDNLWVISSVCIAVLTSTNAFIICFIMRAESIGVTSTVVHFTVICKDFTKWMVWTINDTSFLLCHDIDTCTDDIGAWSGISVASLAGTCGHSSCWIIGANCIGTASSIIWKTWI